MTTTYELYTNENGTPKAVEGKAPAIIERVETLETDVKTLDGDIKTLDGDIKTLDEDVGNIQTAIEVLEGGIVKTINGETPDQAGNIDIPVGHNVGEEWVSYTGKIPNGGVPYCGQIVTRATYADLWAYAQAQGLVKTEAEWQSWASSHGGNVPYYSSGNGSTTFRMPKIVGYVKGASSQSESGSYVTEGLPNITGHGYDNINSTDAIRCTDSSSGAISCEVVSDSRYLANYMNGSTYSNFASITFDASKSNVIYGNSDHVTPETSVVLFGVYAFGEITDVGSLDATALSQAIATIEANVGTKLDKTTVHIVETWRDGHSWYRKYSDGWVEQGGLTKDAVPVTFPVPFCDDMFTLVAMTVVGTGEVRAASENTALRTNATAVIYYSAINYLGFWRAEGYAEE